MDRADIVDEAFRRRLQSRDWPAPASRLSLAACGLDAPALTALFHAQATSRHLDRIARKLQARGEAFYSIGSSGHEGNAAIAAALRPSDPAYLHYRDGAFQIARAAQVPGQTPLWDMALSFTCSREDPISGGRHKVLGAKALAIPPQTSTIASHLPKAVGAAYSIAAAKRIRPEHQSIPDDAIVLCSFGDASLNHSTAQGALNTAGWTAYQGYQLPLLFVCEDNGIGISVKTPAGWVEASASRRPGLRYQRCSGRDVADTVAAASALAQWVRERRRPAFLHMTCVRLYGHAGADAQQAYLSKEEIEAGEANDPLLHTARRLVDEAGMDANDVLHLYQSIDARVTRVAEAAAKRPRLASAKDVMAAIVPPPRPRAIPNRPSQEERAASFGEADMRAMAQPQHMAKLINMALADVMLTHNEIVLAGEDVGAKGGVYGVTQRLSQRFGAHRVIDTLLDEQSILGLAIGMGQNGFVPIPEIQFLAYLHNAEDQLRGEAATLSFFSNGQFANPMVVRIAGLGYQRGFGGHFHNDNSVAVLRDIPGLVVACPSNGYDAVLMLRELVRLARDEQRVCVFIEPIALYMTRDLHEAGDNAWTRLYPPPGAAQIGIGSVGVQGEGEDLAIVSYANGFHLSTQAQKLLAERHGVNARLVDLRWLAPLPVEGLLRAIAACKHVLIVDECRITGSQSEALMALMSERAPGKTLARIAAEDSFIPTGPAYAATLPSRDAIIAAALKLLGRPHMDQGLAHAS